MKRYVWLLIITLITGVTIVVLSNPFYEGFVVFIWVIYFVLFIRQWLDEQADLKVDTQQQITYYLDRQKKRYEADHLRLKRLVETLGSGVLLIAADETIQIVNATFYETFKFKDLKGSTYHQLKSIEPMYQIILEAIMAEKSARAQIAYDEHFYDLIMTPLISNKGYQGLLVLINDITTLKNAEHYQKQFTADVSHELKTPLSALIGMSEILKDKDVDESTRKEFIETIHSEAVRMEVMINDLTTISKMDRIDYALKKEMVRFSKIFKGVKSLLNPLIEAKGLTLNDTINDEKIYVDKNRIHQVLINLIKNAIAYTDEGSIMVSGNKEGEYYKITVQDTGIGMAAEHLPYVFKRFYRIDEGRGRDSGGSGLGLSITKNVVLKHGGQIFVESTQGVGTTFTLLLPI